MRRTRGILPVVLSWVAMLFAAGPGWAAPPKITEFPLPAGSSSPFAIVSGPDGALWFTYAQGIGRITTAGKVTQLMI